MDNSVKKLPAGEVKKRLLEGQLTFEIDIFEKI